MILSTKNHPVTGEELSTYLGYTVLKWVKRPDGSMVVELDVASLTDAEKKVVLGKLSLLGKRVIEAA